jgi:hypothetical protein
MRIWQNRVPGGSREKSGLSLLIKREEVEVSVARLEPVRERRAQVVNLPAEYARGFAEWTAMIIERDWTSSYYAFDFWTTSLWGRDLESLAQLLRRACVNTSCALCPTLNPRSGNRFPLDRAVAVAWLPAQKEDGVLHLHALLRIPVSALDGGTVQMIVKTDGRAVAVEAPTAVTTFATSVLRTCGRAASSLHFDHTEGVMPSVKSVSDDRSQFEGRIEYLLQAGAEVRSWDRFAWTPHRIWARLMKRWVTVGQPAEDEEVRV